MTKRRSRKMPAALLEHFAAMKGKRVELNGKKLKPGKKRARVLKATKRAVKKAAPGTRHASVRFNNPHTFPSGRSLKVENVRGVRSAEALMHKAAKAKRKGKRFYGDVTKKGVHRTVKSASARLQGFTADRPKAPKVAAGGGSGLGLWGDGLAAVGAY